MYEFYMHIHHVSVSPWIKKKERRQFSGLGIKLLKDLLEYIYSLNSIKIFNSLTLEASGRKFNEESQKGLIKYYEKNGFIKQNVSTNDEDCTLMRTNMSLLVKEKRKRKIGKMQLRENPKKVKLDPKFIYD